MGAKVREVRIAVTLGATLLVGQEAWAKPSVHADVVFDGLPTEKELADRWDWLWRTQITPQADDLFEAVKSRARGLPEWDPDTKQLKREPIERASELPAGDVY